MDLRAERRRQRLISAAIVGATTAVGLAIIVAAVVAQSDSGGGEVASPDELMDVSGLGAETQPPWPAPADVPTRAAEAGLPLGPMGTAEHYHVHLDILIDGEPIPVPANIGVDPASQSMSALHTHEEDGIVHIEASEEGQAFTLGQLFTEWNVRLAPDRIGGLVAGDGNTFEAYVNGDKVSTNPAMIELAPHQQIALVYGPADQDVEVPDSYDFPPGV